MAMEKERTAGRWRTLSPGWRVRGLNKAEQKMLEALIARNSEMIDEWLRYLSSGTSYGQPSGARRGPEGR
jgi:hypothetical protein